MFLLNVVVDIYPLVNFCLFLPYPSLISKKELRTSVKNSTPNQRQINFRIHYLQFEQLSTQKSHDDSVVEQAEDGATTIP